MQFELNVQDILPTDSDRATLIGRVWLPGEPAGPAVVVLRSGAVIDITSYCTTVSSLLEDPTRLKDCDGPVIGSVAEILKNSVPDNIDASKPYFLAPIDLQAVKACGVTFVVSMLERVIEEQAKGDPKAAEAVRSTIQKEIGGDIVSVTPGSDEAAKVKKILIERGLWSQYLEVGIGPYAEVFSKAQPMSAVGVGAEIGIHPESTWNNPEPEVVLAVNSKGEIVGATLGNDVNLRDFEGRSALLLGRAKDNNASTSLGPFIRLFDAEFTLDDVRQLDLAMKVEGDDGFVLEDGSTMTKISRDPADLVQQTISRNHQYPDGLVLFTGTLFAPTYDRDASGMGFTHKIGDIVTIKTPRLGALVNRVNLSTEAPPWQFGTGWLMKNLAQRGLL